MKEILKKIIEFNERLNNFSEIIAKGIVGKISEYLDKNGEAFLFNRISCSSIESQQVVKNILKDLEKQDFLLP